MIPSDRGKVLSNTLALVKLRMEKLSSHFSGQGSRCPSFSYSTRILRANIRQQFNHKPPQTLWGQPPTAVQSSVGTGFAGLSREQQPEELARANTRQQLNRKPP